MKTAFIVLALCILATPAAAEWLPYPGYSPTECTWEGTTYLIGPAPIDCSTMPEAVQELIEAPGRLACTAPEDWEEAVVVFTDEVYSWLDCYFANLDAWIRLVKEIRSRRR